MGETLVVDDLASFELDMIDADVADLVTVTLENVISLATGAERV